MPRGIRRLRFAATTIRGLAHVLDVGKGWPPVHTTWKLFTREFDVGFRGGVLKNARKQFGLDKQAGIAVPNPFTFDLIALNKAARSEDKDAAT